MPRKKTQPPVPKETLVIDDCIIEIYDTNRIHTGKGSGPWFSLKFSKLNFISCYAILSASTKKQPRQKILPPPNTFQNFIKTLDMPTNKWEFLCYKDHKGNVIVLNWLIKLSKKAKYNALRQIEILAQQPIENWSKPSPASKLNNHQLKLVGSYNGLKSGYGS